MEAERKPRSGPSKARRIFAWTFSVLGLLFVFIISLLVGVLAHLDTRVVRGLIARQVNGALAALPADRVNLGDIAWLSLRGVKLRSVDADIAGVGRGRVSGVTVRIDLLGTAWRAVLDAVGRKNRTRIEVKAITVDAVDFLLVPGERPASPPSEPSSRELEVVLDRFELAHAYLHGTLSGGRPVDVDGDQLWVRGAMDGRHVEGAVKGKIVARALVPRPVEVDLDGDGLMGLKGSTDRRAKVTLKVLAAEASLSGKASLSGDAVEAELDLGETPPEAVRALFPTAPVYAPVAATVHASGTLPRIDFRVEARAGRGNLTTDGHVQLDDGPTVEASIAARDVDLAAFSQGGPTSRLGLNADGKLRLVPARGQTLPVSGVVTLHTLPGTVGDKPIPVMEARADIARDHAHATATIDEPGMPVRIEVDRDKSGRIRAAVDAAASSLADVPLLQRIGGPASGRFSLTALATLSGEELEARAQVDATQLDVAEVGVRSAHIEATAKGPLRAPTGAVSGRLSGLRRGPWALTTLALDARGTPSNFAAKLRGKGGSFTQIALDGAVRRGDTTRVSGVTGRVVRAGQAVVLHVKEVAVAPDQIAVDELRLEGLGAPIGASMRRSATATTARVEAPSIELERVAKLMGMDPRKLGGRGSIDMTFELGARKTAAKGQIRVTALRYGTAPKLDARLDIDLDGKAVKAEFHGENTEIGSADLAVDGTLGGPLQSAAALEGAVGKVTFSTERLALGRLCQSMSCPGELGGAVSSVGAVLGAHLEVTRQKKAEAGPDTEIRLAAQVEDQHGRLAHLDASTKLDLAPTLRSRRLPNDAPIDVDFGLDPRAVEQLPATLRPAGLFGTVQMRAQVKGSVAKPHLVVELGGEKVHYQHRGRAESPELDIKWVTKYDLERATSDLDVQSGGQRVLGASAKLNAALADLVDAKGKERPWNAGVDVEVERFPLGFLPAFAESGMRGNLSGKVSVRGIHQNPAVDGNLTIDGLRTAHEDVGTVAVSLKVDEHRCTAGVDARQAAGQSAVVLRASAGCAWKNATVPGLDTSTPVDVTLDTTAFPLAALSPALRNAVQRLGGKVDVHLKAHGSPDPAATDWQLDGTAQIQGGNMLPLAVGREIRKLELSMKIGLTGVQIDKLSGEMGGGAFFGNGAVELRDRTLSAARMEMHVPRLHPLPLTIQGVSYGNVWGDIFANARVADKKVLVDLKAPTLRFELPPQRTASLEKIEDNPAVAVLQPIGPEQKEKPETAVGGGPPVLTLVPGGIVVNLELGNNVGISRDDLKVELQTPPPPENPKLTLEGEPKLDGSIVILGGRVPVAGKVFRIERGTVRFGGADISNPSLDIYAVYDGDDIPSVTSLNVHVGGTAKDIQLSLTSTPTLPQSELLAKLAFGDGGPAGALGGSGSKSGSSGDSQGSSSGTSGAAAGVGSAVLTQGLNQLLSQTIIPIRASISGTSSASATVDLSERIRVEYIVQLTSTSYGQPQDTNLLAFDWRFRPRWMLRTQVGDKGTTSVDLLWQRWY